MGYKIKSELTEKQIESDIATYLGWCTPNSELPFRLLDIDEQITGSDKKFDKVFPLYLQFKVSEGLKPLTTRIINPITRNYPLNKIRKFRSKNSLADNPIFYFKLRNLAKTAHELQHNILIKLANTGVSQSMYIAPLTLSKDDYESKLFDNRTRYLHYPFRDKDYELYQSSWISNFLQVPFLRQHISIVPHERVNDSNHFYSFSSTGTQVAFHSPLELQNKDNRFSTQLIKLLDGLLYTREYQNYSFENNINHIDQILRSDYNKSYNKENGLEILKQQGLELYNKYEIRQILVLLKS